MAGLADTYALLVAPLLNQVGYLPPLGQCRVRTWFRPQTEGATAPLGKLLFTQYLLPFEIVSVLLLVAMVGVILLSKKDLK